MEGVHGATYLDCDRDPSSRRWFKMADNDGCCRKLEERVPRDLVAGWRSTRLPSLFLLSFRPPSGRNGNSVVTKWRQFGVSDGRV